MFEVAARNGVTGAMLEIARKRVHWGVEYESKRMYAESRTEFNGARALLEKIIASGDGPFAGQATRLRGELG